MSENERITPVRSTNTGTIGRSLNRARTNHFVLDEPEFAGGPGEATTPEESFLAGVSSCGVMLMEKFAEEEGVDLEEITVEIRGVRSKDDPSEFRRVELEVTMEGPDCKQAERLLDRFEHR